MKPKRSISDAARAVETISTPNVQQLSEVAKKRRALHIEEDTKDTDPLYLSETLESETRSRVKDQNPIVDTNSKTQFSGVQPSC